MDVNRMTERMQSGIFHAQTIASNRHHQEIDEVHLYLAFMQDTDNLVTAILEKLHAIACK